MKKPPKMVLTDRQTNLLSHSVAANARRGREGYRNHFAATISSPAYNEFIMMVKEGFAVSGQQINNSTMQYFHVTKKGCEAIGMSKAATKRALED